MPNISSKQIQWVLNKATPDIALSKQSITLGSDNLTDTFTITTNSDGNLSVSSSDNSIATVSLSGNTAKVEALTDGSATITVNVAESSNYLSRNTSLPVSVSLASTTLNDNSWETISQISQAGTASNYWNVGDTKEVILNGNMTESNAIKSFNNYSCYATILGFDHAASLETNGEHSIHFIIGKNSSGKDIMFLGFPMTENNNTSVGWNGSKMKQTTMVEFKNCLPSVLQSVLKIVTKYTDNTGNGSNASGNVTASTEEVFLLSEFELHGARTYANQYEKDKQVQYTYYKNGNSKVRYRDDNGSADGMWLRSPYCNGTGGFCCMGNNGGATYFGGPYSFSVAPAFVV